MLNYREVVLESYLAERRNPVRLQADIFSFYIYEWAINDAQQNEYDWESLQDYLPPARELMEEGIAAVQNTLGRYHLLPKNSGG